MKKIIVKIIVSCVLAVVLLFLTAITSLAELMPHHDTLSMGLKLEDIINLEDSMGHEHYIVNNYMSFTQSFGDISVSRMTATYNDEVSEIDYWFNDSKELVGIEYSYSISNSNFDGEEIYFQLQDQLTKKYGKDYLENDILSDDLYSFGLDRLLMTRTLMNDFRHEYYEILGLNEWHISSDYHTIIDLFCVQTENNRGPLYPHVCFRFVSNEDFEKAEK